ncbi:hypothetical protein D3C76_1694510 [compost metagenome]
MAVTAKAASAIPAAVQDKDASPLVPTTSPPRADPPAIPVLAATGFSEAAKSREPGECSTASSIRYSCDVTFRILDTQALRIRKTRPSTGIGAAKKKRT